MRLARRAEIQDIDRRATDEHGIPSARLMEAAGALMAEEIRRDRGWTRARGVLVLCGPGKNGGDGEVIARRLREARLNVEVWREADGRAIPPLGELSARGLIVDALFGVGLNRAVEGRLRELIARVNACGCPVFAVDVPSGLDADRGVALGAAVRATRTLTCGLAKPGFFLQDGPALAGRITVLKIGFPAGLEREVARTTFLIGLPSAAKLVPRGPATANKTGFGRVLVIGGRRGMEGAAILAATAAARAGAGYVTLCMPDGAPPERLPDFLTLEWGKLAGENLSRSSAIVIGPGLGTGDDRREILKKVLAAGVKTVVDADALTILAENPEMRTHRNCVITPHAGELARLIPFKAADIEGDRLAFARLAAERAGAVALLKGLHTVVDDGRGSWIVGSGNSALAKAGTGDVLSGFIAGFAAQGLGIAEAAVLGAFVHGDIADRWVRAGKGSRTLLASDLPKSLSKTMRALERARRGSSRRAGRKLTSV